MLLGEIPPTSHDKEITDDVSENFHVARQLWKDIGSAVHAGDKEVLSIAYISCSVTRQVLVVSAVTHVKYV
jgi:hypothetical protein